ncbi:hypothetical protein GCM10027066_24770 [Dyella jejuensis]
MRGECNKRRAADSEGAGTWACLHDVAGALAGRRSSLDALNRPRDFPILADSRSTAETSAAIMANYRTTSPVTP